MKNPAQVKLNEGGVLSMRKSQKHERKLGWTFQEKSS